MSDFVPKDTSPIELYMHCTQCLFELPVGTSPAAYSRTQTGITTEGEVLVWCIRHDMLVANLGRTSRLTAGPKCDVPGCACSKVPS